MTPVNVDESLRLGGNSCLLCIVALCLVVVWSQLTYSLVSSHHSTTKNFWCISFSFFLFFFLTYNIVLVSGLQHSDSIFAYMQNQIFKNAEWLVKPYPYYLDLYCLNVYPYHLALTTINLLSFLFSPSPPPFCSGYRGGRQEAVL